MQNNTIELRKSCLEIIRLFSSLKIKGDAMGLLENSFQNVALKLLYLN